MSQEARDPEAGHAPSHVPGLSRDELLALLDRKLTKADLIGLLSGQSPASLAGGPSDSPSASCAHAPPLLHVTSHSAHRRGHSRSDGDRERGRRQSVDRQRGERQREAHGERHSHIHRHRHREAFKRGARDGECTGDADEESGEGGVCVRQRREREEREREEREREDRHSRGERERRHTDRHRDRDSRRRTEKPRSDRPLFASEDREREVSHDALACVCLPVCALAYV